MATFAAIRLQVETALAKRVPAVLTLKIKQAPELFSTGTAEIDAVLGGGIPRGSITEVAGAASTGKTSFALSSIAAITQSGAACAWVDVSDALSPESAAANIVMKRLLWLRMSSDRKKPVADKPWSRLEQALTATDLLLQAGGFAAIVLDMSDVRPQDATRIPLQHWYRFRLAAEQARNALVLLTQTPCAKSCSALALRSEPSSVQPFSHNGRRPYSRDNDTGWSARGTATKVLHCILRSRPHGLNGTLKRLRELEGEERDASRTLHQDHISCLEAAFHHKRSPGCQPCADQSCRFRIGKAARSAGKATSRSNHHLSCATVGTIPRDVSECLRQGNIRWLASDPVGKEKGDDLVANLKFFYAFADGGHHPTWECVCPL
jgi:hypothetical protein